MSFVSHRCRTFQQSKELSWYSYQGPSILVGKATPKSLQDLFDNLSVQFNELEELGHFDVDADADGWANHILTVQDLEQRELEQHIANAAALLEELSLAIKSQEAVITSVAVTVEIARKALDQAEQRHAEVLENLKELVSKKQKA